MPIDYLEWNNRISAHFFRPDLAGKPILLYVSEDLIGELGRAVGLGVRDFVTVVKDGVPWATRGSLCARALEALEGWRSRGLEYPPYIACLALFVLAVGAEGDYAPHNYYKRLRDLIGEPPGPALPHFERMHELWDDLENWSGTDKKGELGVFRFRTIGGWAHVGIPKAQKLLTEDERRELTGIFAQADIDPTAPPSDEGLARAVMRNGGSRLRVRTQQTLHGGSDIDPEVRDALLQTIADELAEWDGSVTGVGTAVHPPTTLGQLRLCAHLDQTARRVSMFLRCATNRALPDEELVLAAPGGLTLRCEEEGAGLTSPVVREEDRSLFDASTLDWSAGAAFKAQGGAWMVRLHGAPIRVLVSASNLGLPGLVENRQVPRGAPFWLLVQRDHVVHIDSWLSGECSGRREITIEVGLPAQWRMFEIERALDDKSVKDLYPVLALQRLAEIRFVGGVRSDAGSNFFRFAPPAIAFEGGEGSEQLYCEGERLQRDSSQLYRMPVSAVGRLRIEARRGSVPVARRNLSLVEPTGIANPNPTRFVDRFNRPLDDDAKTDIHRAHGPLVLPDRPPSSESDFVLPFYEEGHIHFVGRRAGEVWIWPSESAPSGWTPVWAITTGRRMRSTYCGSSIGADRPSSDGEPDSKRKKLWKEILWWDRKRIAPPPHPALRRLWEEYQEVARHVR